MPSQTTLTLLHRDAKKRVFWQGTVKRTVYSVQYEKRYDFLCCFKLVCRGSRGSTKPVNFLRRVLKPVNFVRYLIETRYFGFLLPIFRWCTFLKEVPNPSIQNPCAAPGWYVLKCVCVCVRVCVRVCVLVCVPVCVRVCVSVSS